MIQDLQVQTKVRCAIYTRKSLEEGLDQDFNTLDAQHESAESFISSQRAEGWVLLPEHYDDGGYTGSNLERPALQRLLRDIDAGLIDCVVVYKLDRLSRSLLDFTALLSRFDDNNVSFVSVTQPFNSSTSTGRLMMNILLTFAEFEREMISERTRDKVHAARKRGKYTGGHLPLGYQISDNKRMIVDPQEAKLVNRIFTRYQQVRSAKIICNELNLEGIRTKAYQTKTGKRTGNHAWKTTDVYRVLRNCVYIGKVTLKGEQYNGEHDAIVEQRLFDAVQRLLGATASKRYRQRDQISEGGFLDGLVRCAECGSAMTPSNTTKKKVRYRYYRCVAQQKGEKCKLAGVPAADLEQHVFEQCLKTFQSTDMISRVLDHLDEDSRAEAERLLQNAADVRAIWDELFVVEQQTVVALLMESVVVGLEQTVCRYHSGDQVQLDIKARRRSGRTRLIRGPVVTQQASDKVMLAIAKGRKWLEELELGYAASIGELAQKYGVEPAFMRKHIKIGVIPAHELVKLIEADVSIHGLMQRTAE